MATIIQQYKSLKSKLDKLREERTELLDSWLSFDLKSHKNALSEIHMHFFSKNDLKNVEYLEMIHFYNERINSFKEDFGILQKQIKLNKTLQKSILNQMSNLI